MTFSVARLTVAGALDTTFDGDGKQMIDFGASTDVGLSVAVDASDRVLMAGYSYQAGANDFAVVRLTVDGALDNTFDSDGRQTVDFGSAADIGQSVAVDSQGRILLAGYSYQTVGNDFAVARLTDGGALDTTFDGDGKQTIDFGSSGDIGLSVALDSLDRVVVGGYSYQGVKRDYDFAVARLDAAGALDTSFDDDGKQTIDFGGTRDIGYTAALDAFGRVLVAGYSEQPITGADFALARLGAALPPQAEAGGPYSVLEGGTVQLDASATTDPDQSNATLMYAWDFDGDAIYGETGTAYGDETGMQPVFSAAGLDGPTTVTVSLRVTDQTGLSSTDTATVNVSNVAPHDVAVAGPTSGVPGQTRSFQTSFSDPGVADTHTYQWKVTRDNAPYALPAGTITTASHFSFTPDRTGSYRVEVAITDDDGGVGQGHRNLAVVAVEVQDETCGTGKVLAGGGTTSDDTIVFAPGATTGEVSVSITECCKVCSLRLRGCWHSGKRGTTTSKSPAVLHCRPGCLAAMATIGSKAGPGTISFLGGWGTTCSWAAQAAISSPAKRGRTVWWETPMKTLSSAVACVLRRSMPRYVPSWPNGPPAEITPPA